MKVRFAMLLMLVAFMATGGCLDRTLRPLIPCTLSGVVQNVPINQNGNVDLLFVIDNSSSMEEEQLELTDRLDEMVAALLNGGGPGIDPFPPVLSLNVAVVTTDIGSEPVNGQAVGGGGNGDCTASTSDRAIAQRDGAMADCLPSSENWAVYPANTSNPATLQSEVQCIVQQGIAGCGFEQQLEATVQTFDGQNAGFLRSDAILAIVLVTDEEDCSADDPDIFDISDTNNLAGPFFDDALPRPNPSNVKTNLRCTEFADRLKPVADYVTQIASLKDDPAQVVFAAIAGVPDPNVVSGVDLEDFEALLARPDMTPTPDGDSNGLTPVCERFNGATLVTSASPGRRMVEVAQGLEQEGVAVVVESICAESYANAVNNIASKIGDALRDICLPNPLNRNAEGKVNCEVVEVQPDGGKCADVGRGRSAEPIRLEEASDGTTREVCLIEQQPSNAGVPTDLGWFYDDFTSAKDVCPMPQQRVSFVGEESKPAAGTRVRFECLTAVTPIETDIGTACATDAECARSAESLEEQYDRANLSLACESLTNTCQLACSVAADCPGGFTCLNEDLDGNPITEPFCVNPTCTID